jgi:hypothetical protein
MVVCFFLNLAKNKSIEESILFHKLLLGSVQFSKRFGTGSKKNSYRTFRLF